MPVQDANKHAVRFKAVWPALLLGFALPFLLPGIALAQTQNIPNFWHPGERQAKPDLSGIQRLRFLTTTDFPPFNFIDRRKRLTGFHIDLARAVCSELGIAAKCQIQALPWDELAPALERGDGDAIIAGIEISPQSRERYEFSRPYLHVPGRFVASRVAGAQEPPEKRIQAGKTTGLIEGSNHEKWFTVAFSKAKTIKFQTRDAALQALQDGKVDLVFTDAVSLSFWLVSEQAKGCCALSGGAYLSEAFFGHGMAIAYPKGRGDLAAATDYALRELADKGIYAELYLRYFPISLY